MRPVKKSPPSSSSIQSPTFIIIIFFFFTVFPGTQCRHREDCPSSFDCGKLKQISYPFWGHNQSHCGQQDFELKCKPNKYPVMKRDTQRFIVLGIEQNSQWIKLARWDIWYGHCPRRETQLNQPPFRFNYTRTQNLTVFRGCQGSFIKKLSYNFSCNSKNGGIDYGYVTREWEARNANFGCELQTTLPVLIKASAQLAHGTLKLEQVLKAGFVADYHYDEEEFCKVCRATRGYCVPRGTNWTQVDCINGRLGFSQFVGAIYFGYGFVGFVSGAIFALLVVFAYKITKRFRRIIETITEKDPNLETYIKKHGSLAPKRYHCSDIKKITNSFREKLGEGGFCSVYKGKLDDGRLVAVKVLKTDRSKGNGEDFLNEVISICKTSHVNIVSLLGYCCTAYKKALLFEFMPNGSLEKFIHNENISTAGRLEWVKLHDIVMGIARGLEYLHRGCNTRILHLDIKPHNVLLDENFCPKISDFGLAKLCPKESVISMSNARGTVGYIAPELFSRNFGRVSHKADVYSFGMMVLEMVGGRKNIDETADDSSEIYYPHWVYDRLQEENSLGLHGVMTNQDNEIAKKMIITGLWCIQTYPGQRPSMNEVLFMLEGSLDSLEIPPKPFVYTPSRTPMYDELND